MKAKLVIETLSESNSIYDPREENGDRFTRNFYADRRREPNWGKGSKESKPEIKPPRIPKPIKKRIPSLWNKKKYQSWIKDMSWYEGDEEPGNFGYEMAQNASHENGLIDYVNNVIKREGGDENALDRIQWDIEGNMNEYGSGRLPAGADDDHRAPYNQKDSSYNLELRDGEFVLHNNDETFQFDHADVDELLAALLDIDIEELKQDGESIIIYNVDSYDDYAKVATDKGEVDVDYRDLEDIKYSADY